MAENFVFGNLKFPAGGGSTVAPPPPVIATSMTFRHVRRALSITEQRLLCPPVMLLPLPPGGIKLRNYQVNWRSVVVGTHGSLKMS